MKKLSGTNYTTNIDVVKEFLKDLPDGTVRGFRNLLTLVNMKFPNIQIRESDLVTLIGQAGTGQKFKSEVIEYTNIISQKTFVQSKVNKKKSYLQSIIKKGMLARDVYNIVVKEHPEYFKNLQVMRSFMCSNNIKLDNEYTARIREQKSNSRTYVDIFYEFISNTVTKNKTADTLYKELVEKYGEDTMSRTYFGNLLSSKGIEYDNKPTSKRSRVYTTRRRRARKSYLDFLTDVDTTNMTFKEIRQLAERKVGKTVSKTTLYSYLSKNNKSYILCDVQGNPILDTTSEVDTKPENVGIDIDKGVKLKPVVNKVDKNKVSHLLNNETFVLHLGMLSRSRTVKEMTPVLNLMNYEPGLKLTEQDVVELLKQSGFTPRQEHILGAPEEDEEYVYLWDSKIPKDSYYEVRHTMDVASLKNKCIETLPYTPEELKFALQVITDLRKWYPRYVKNSRSQFELSKLYLEDIRHEIERENPVDGGNRTCALMNIKRNLEYSKKYISAIEPMLKSSVISEKMIEEINTSFNEQYYKQENPIYRPAVDLNAVDKYSWCETDETMKDNTTLYKQPERKLLTSSKAQETLTPKQLELNRHKYKVSYEISGGRYGMFKRQFRTCIALTEEDAKNTILTQLKAEDASTFVSNVRVDFIGDVT